MTPLLHWMAEYQARTENALQETLPAAGHAPQRLHQAMRYAVLEGGKRIRPLLCFAAAEAAGAPAEAALPAACALEFIHAYSLVHDDLPAMDNDVLRRGRPTVHVEYDEATALLVGDALQSLAFECLARPGAAPAARQPGMLALLAQAAGSRGMAGGQAIDLESVNQSLSLPELEFMHILKTGALIRASVGLGARYGEIDETALGQLDHYAKCVGLAFQVVDDILDATASTATLGKTSGKDAAQNKPTYVSLMGLARAREFSASLRADALASLSGFGPAAARLRELASYIIDREY
jgi:farnesyl diphosphate synthase